MLVSRDYDMKRLAVGFLLALLLTPTLGEEPKKGATVQVPYRLTETKHVLVRAKLNGKGPFNFILDTGAPALFVATAVAKKVGVEPDQGGWGTFDKFELEGGLEIPKAQGQIADPFQLEGMNKLGLAGVELHGVIGFNLIARFKIELDFTRDRMGWTRLDFDPPLPEKLKGKAPASLEAMAGLVKVMAALMGKQKEREVKVRGFLGVEVEEKDGSLVVRGVLEGSPAALAGLKVGDQLTHFQEQPVKTVAELQKQSAERQAGETVKLTLLRGGEKKELEIKLAKGF